jgi:predicted acylesterase/phospholipase RssA
MSNIGLVLSGGMAKGAYQIGALQALNEILKPADIKYISAASIGALNTYAFLTNGLNKGIELWNSLDNNNNRKFVTTLLKSCFIQDSIKKIVTDTEISNPFFIPLVNFRKRKLIYADIAKIRSEDIEPYLRASVAMPVFNTGVNINNECFFDGGMIDNIPIYPIRKKKLDYVICIYFDNYNYTFESKNLDNKIVKINFTDNKLVSNSICFKKDSIKYMINEGYAKTKRILDYIFAGGVEDTESIYARISDLNNWHTDRSLRITGDVIVNNMNRVSKKLMRRIQVT